MFHTICKHKNTITRHIKRKMEAINIFWFRRDLRIEDNAGLYHALNSGLPVLPVFIFDKIILDRLKGNDPRITFIHKQILNLKKICEENGSSLKILYGKPLEVFQQLANDYRVQSVFTNRDYEPYAINRDQSVNEFLSEKGIQFYDFKDQVVFDRNEITKEDGSPYTVFTPYKRKWQSKLTNRYLEEFPSQKILNNLYKTTSFNTIRLEDIGFKTSEIQAIDFDISEEKIKNYALKRDFPAENGTSRLSVHLRFGTVSIRKISRMALKTSETFLNELTWRNFYMNILWNFPYVENRSFKPQYDRIEWRNNEQEFEKWCRGETGYPLVDAGMRELNETGYMHNRVRMVVASFLCKHLLIDWRWGEAYFAEKLLDYDLAANNGGWQWASGSGCDATPYFRVFNPVLQAQKFDPNNNYIRKWIPEYETTEYPQPIIEHSFARERAIENYKRYLKPE